MIDKYDFLEFVSTLEQQDKNPSEIIKCIKEYVSSLGNEINRVEVINHQEQPIGRVFVKHNCEKVDIQLQDQNRTLKIFIRKN